MSGQSLKLFTKMPEIWRSMLEDIASAKKYVHLEQYILRGAGVGRRFLELLKKKAAAGVEAKVILDVVGSWPLLKDFRLRKELKASGVELKWYNPVAFGHIFNIQRNYYRTHRKLLVVDGQVAHVGGAGVDQDMSKWQDLHGRVEERSVIQGVDRAFLSLWDRVHLPWPKVFSQVEESQNGEGLCLLFNSGNGGQQKIFEEKKKAILGARKRVWLAVSYFIPHSLLLDLLKTQASKGLDVRVLLPKKSDLPLLDMAARSFIGELIKSGVKTYLYEKGILHIKALLVDEAWATFGSMNWDSKSFFHNLESNLVLHKREDVQLVEENLISLFANSEQISYSEWVGRGYLNRLSEVLLKPFHKIL